MKLLIRMALFAAALATSIILIGQLGLLRGKAPDDLGVRHGRLKPPAITPNSVSSQAELFPGHAQRVAAQIAPFKFNGDGKAALQRLAQLLKLSRNTVLVQQQSDYLYAQCETELLRFTDDLEFYLDEGAGVIQVRSASRIGNSDLGTNRQRVEALRRLFVP